MSSLIDPIDRPVDSWEAGSSPVPNRWIPWCVMALATALILVAFLIPAAFAPG